MSLPFDEVKYNSLMSRLEAVEVRLSNVKQESTMRLDSQFYEKIYDKISSYISKYNTTTLKSLSNWITQGPNPVFSDNAEIPCLTGRNIAGGRVNYHNADYINEAEYNELSKYQLKIGDTLITLKGRGSIGKIGYVTEVKKAIFSRNIGLIRPNEKINSAYINAYIMSKYGQILISRGETGGTGQATLTTSYINSIPVPLFKNLENSIAEVLINSERILKESTFIYTAAQSLLLSELGLAGYTPTKENVSVKSFADSFGSSGRLDAEYYQPKYEEVEEKIKSYKNGFKNFRSACNLYDDNFTPNDNADYKYIELSNIGSHGDITNVAFQLGKELPTRARRKITAGQVIISSIEGSLESCALVIDEYDNALCSTGFYVINSDLINSETLLILFKLFPIQSMLKQRCSGTILTAINKEELLSIPIPIIADDVQEKIASMVKEIYATRKKSAELLDYAKQALEIAIEQGENVAVKWLEEKGVQQ